VALLESSWYIEKLMVNKLGILQTDPSIIKLDSCGPWSNDVGLLTFLVK
jgi:hypothetical protein